LLPFLAVYFYVLSSKETAAVFAVILPGIETPLKQYFCADKYWPPHLLGFRFRYYLVEVIRQIVLVDLNYFVGFEIIYLFNLLTIV
jgi:hypothetical protein